MPCDHLNVILFLAGFELFSSFFFAFRGFVVSAFLKAVSRLQTGPLARSSLGNKRCARNVHRWRLAPTQRTGCRAFLHAMLSRKRSPRGISRRCSPSATQVCSQTTLSKKTVNCCFIHFSLFSLQVFRGPGFQKHSVKELKNLKSDFQNVYCFLLLLLLR